MFNGAMHDVRRTVGGLSDSLRTHLARRPGRGTLTFTACVPIRGGPSGEPGNERPYRDTTPFLVHARPDLHRRHGHALLGGHGHVDLRFLQQIELVARRERFIDGLRRDER